jgi:subtilisin family serine protease
VRRGARITLITFLTTSLLAAMPSTSAGAADDNGLGDTPKTSESRPLRPGEAPPLDEPSLDPVLELQAAAVADGTVEVIVGVEPGNDPTTTVAAALGADPSEVQAVTPEAATVEVSADQVAALDAAPGVTSIEENQQLELFLWESIPRIGADVAHDNSRFGSGRRIAVIDSGIEAEHDAFDDAISHDEAACFVSHPDADDPCPGGYGSTGPGVAAPCAVAACFHGTHVASIAAGRSGAGEAGVAPGAEIIPIRIFYSDAQDGSLEGGSTAHVDDLVAALEHVRLLDLADPIDAVNLSLGFYQRSAAGFCDHLNPTLTDTIRQLRDQNVAVVVASGNSGDSTFVASPACIEPATAVTATLDVSDDVWYLSDTGSPVSLAAPGSSIIAANVGGGTTSASGTSMAAPHVAGAIALLREQYGEQPVTWIEERLWSTGASVVDPTNGLQLRRIDVAAALGLRAPPARPATTSLFAVTNRGRIYTGGPASYWGDQPPLQWGEHIVAGTSTRSGMGYWLASNWGRVFAYGDAHHSGDMAGQPLQKPISAMTTTASGRGYWLLAEDGGIFTFGDAAFHGSTGNLRLNAPVTDLARTPTGNGYWLTAKDGGVFTFGDAAFFGSTGGLTLNQPVVSIAAGPTTGYWLVALDGGLFAFGVPFLGSLPGERVTGETGHRIRATAGGRGYYITTRQGGVYPFGVTNAFGRIEGLGLWEEVVDLMIPPE